MGRPRYETLDTVRGLALVSMIAYHASWDLVYMFGVDWPFYHSFGAHVCKDGRAHDDHVPVQKTLIKFV